MSAIEAARRIRHIELHASDEVKAVRDAIQAFQSLSHEELSALLDAVAAQIEAVHWADMSVVVDRLQEATEALDDTFAYVPFQEAA